MPRTGGEIGRSRRDKRRAFTDRCATSRPVSTSSAGPGELDEKTYQPHLSEVRCNYIPGREVEVERAGRTVRLRTLAVAMPHGTDVTSGDLITSVVNILGEQINAKNLSIVGVNALPAHLECVVEELSTP